MRNFFLTIWYKYKEWQYERKCIKHLGIKPQKIYLSKEDFDALQKRLNDPLPPEAIENLKRIMNRSAPWDNQ